MRPVERAVPGIANAVARRVESLPEHLAGGSAYSPMGETAGDDILLRAAGIGRFLARGGRLIEYAPETGANPRVVDRFLWGAARSALIHQRGEMPLHASAVIRPDGKGAIALCGPPGAGKSTTAVALLQLGWHFLADDQARLTLAEAAVMVWPGPATLRLLPDALAALEIDAAGLVRDDDPEGKRLLPVEKPAAATPLLAIIELGGATAEISLERLSPAAALAALSRHVVGPRKMRALTSMQDHLVLVNQIADRAPIYRLHGRKLASAKRLAGKLTSSFG